MPKSHAKGAPEQEPPWLILNDFSPGIRQRTNYVSAANTVSPNKIWGAATENTFRCIALPSGGLGPLPKRDYTYSPSLAALDAIGNVANGRYTISGFHVAGPITVAAAGGSDAVEFHIIYEYTNTSTVKRRYQWQRHRIWEASPTIDSLKNITSTEATPSSTYRPSYMHNYRSDSSAATTPGQPQVANTWYSGGGSDEKLWELYPDAASSNSNTVKDVTTTLAVELSLGHQGRSVVFNQVPYNHGTVGTWSSNEQVFYTNSNLQTLASSTATVFGQENVTGYGVTGSLNASELFLVKKQDGAYLIRGDIASPTVLHLPGVIATGNDAHQGASTPIGFCYLSRDFGAWVWNGGEVSQQISNQLEGNFYKQGMTNDFIDYKGRIALWREWILFPNNWLYSYKTQAWWKIEDQSVVRILQWSTSINLPRIYGVPATVVSGVVVSGFTATTPASTYQWESQPIPQTIDRTVEIRGAVLVAQGTGTIVVTLTATGGTTDTKTITLSGTDLPQIYRWNTYATKGTEVQVKFVADNGGSGPAPVIHEFRMDCVASNTVVSS